MTSAEIEAERIYRREERLAILCGNASPTPEQNRIADREANEAVRQLKQEEIQQEFL